MLRIDNSSRQSVCHLPLVEGDVAVRADPYQILRVDGPRVQEAANRCSAPYVSPDGVSEAEVKAAGELDVANIAAGSFPVALAKAEAMKWSPPRAIATAPRAEMRFAASRRGGRQYLPIDVGDGEVTQVTDTVADEVGVSRDPRV